MNESLILQVSEIAGAAARVTKIELRNHPKCADRGERPRFGSIQGVVAVATVHQLAVMAMRQVKVADERISWIKCATVMLPGSFPVTFGAPIAVTVTGVLLTVLGEPATTASERDVFVFTIVNAVFTVARIDITRIEIA